MEPHAVPSRPIRAWVVLVSPMRPGDSTRTHRALGRSLCGKQAVVRSSSEPAAGFLEKGVHHPFVCPATGDPLVHDGDRLIGRSGVSFPVLHGVPLLVAGARIERMDIAISGEFLDDMTALAHRGLPEGSRDALADAFKHSFKFREPWLSGEAKQFLNRLRSSGFRIREPYAFRDPDVAAPSATGAPEVHIVAEPRVVPAGRRVSVHVKIANHTAETFNAHGDGAVHLAASVSQAGKFSDRLRTFWKAREPNECTRLLVDIEPGRSLAQPVVINLPNKSGRATYRIDLVKGNRTLASVTSGTDLVLAEHDPLKVAWPHTNTIRSYNDDHKHAFEVLLEWFSTYIPRPDPIVLEIGGGFGPMMYWWEGQRYNLDIDPLSLISHTLLLKPGAPQAAAFANIMGNAMALPFADGSLDAIVMFATFHHFPDPQRLLAHLRTKIRPDGIVALLCEPMGHIFADDIPEDFLHELKLGAYEQSFELWEYACFFREAGFSVVDAVVDHGSVKVALRPC
jgi:SAM-dependent methyltransferase